MQVLEKLESVSSNLAHSASAQRAYIITGNYQYLASYQSYVQDSQKVVMDLRDLIKDNPVQEKRVDALDKQVKERLSTMEVCLNEYQNKGQNAAFEYIKGGKGQLFLTRILELIGDMRESEQDLLAHRTIDMTRSADNSKLVIITGSVLVVTLLGTFNFFFGQSILRCVQILQKTAANIERGRYDTTADIQSQDEFRDIAEAFNKLGMLLQGKVDELRLQQNGLDGIEENLANIRRKLDDSTFAMESANQNASSSLKAVENIGRAAVRSCTELMSTLDTAIQRGASNNMNTSELCNEIEALHRVSASLESLSTELNVIGLSVSMEAAKASEFGKAMMPVADKLNRLSDQSREETVRANQTISSVLIVAARLRSVTEELLSTLRTSQHLLAKLTQDIYSASETMEETKEHTNKLLALSSTLSGGLTSGRHQVNELAGQMSMRKKEILEAIESTAETVPTDQS